MPQTALKVTVKLLSRVQLFATPWTVAHQVSLFMEFSRQEYWSGLPFSTPGDPPGPGIGTCVSFTTALPGKPIIQYSQILN